MGIVLGVVLAYAIVFGFVSAMVWVNKGGHADIGFAWGFFLGLIGLIYVAVATPRSAVAVPISPAQPTPATGPTAGDPVPSDGAEPKAMRECPSCREAMRRDASVCPHCRRESPAWSYRSGVWWSTNEEGSEVYRDEPSARWLDPAVIPVPAEMQRPCPSCGASMPRMSRTCPACGQASQPWTYRDGAWWTLNPYGVGFRLDETTGQWVRG